MVKCDIYHGLAVFFLLKLLKFAICCLIVIFPANLIVVVVGFISVIVLIVVFIEVLEPPTPSIFCSTIIVRSAPACFSSLTFLPRSFAALRIS